MKREGKSGEIQADEPHPDRSLDPGAPDFMKWLSQ
jgi:hypothetical protein